MVAGLLCLPMTRIEAIIMNLTSVCSGETTMNPAGNQMTLENFTNL